MKTLVDSVHAQQAHTTLPPHVIIGALAGTGKTTTLEQALCRLFDMPTRIEPSPQQQAIWDAVELSRGVARNSVCFCAFNKAIAVELERRVPQGCNAMTMHSMGYKAVQSAFGRLGKPNEYRVDNIIEEILGINIRELKQDPSTFEVVRGTKKLTSLCKVNLIGGSNNGVTTEELDALAAHYDVELNGSRSRVFDLVPKVLERCKNVDKDRYIDFDDMVWLPIALDLPVTRYDLLLVDEFQDTNRCQQALARKAGRRLILCGDVHQAIYGFAGADAESMTRMEEELSATPQGCTMLPLTVTRRCGKAIVAEAQQIVPEFEAHDSNSDGTILRADYAQSKVGTGGCYLDIVQKGDMCICRVNAPLVSQCLKLLKQGIKAEIQGRDVGQGLITLINKQKASDVADLIGKLDDWQNRERDKELAKRTPSDSRLIAIEDKFDCVVCFTEGATTIAEVISKIERIFTDNREIPGIKFSTIHKAKGLEAKRVFLLEPDKATVPHPMAKTPWQIGQEWNLRYVAITRAIEVLVYVTGSPNAQGQALRGVESSS